MNIHAIHTLFMKDLFLSRRYLFAYFIGAVASTLLAVIPDATIAFAGFILMLTVAIAAGIHFIGTLMLAESTDQTKVFVMSMPVSLLDYSISKLSVVLVTYLIPWSIMFALATIAAFVLPWGTQGSAVVLPAIFFFLLCSFMLQLVTAVVTESIGWTISVMVLGNVTLNLFLMKLFSIAEIAAATKSQHFVWPSILTTIILFEALAIVATLIVAIIFQTRKRDLV